MYEGAPENKVFRAPMENVNCEGGKANINAGPLTFRSGGKLEPISSSFKEITRKGRPGNEMLKQEWERGL